MGTRLNRRRYVMAIEGGDEPIEEQIVVSKVEYQKYISGYNTSTNKLTYTSNSNYRVIRIDLPYYITKCKVNQGDSKNDSYTAFYDGSTYLVRYAANPNPRNDINLSTPSNRIYLSFRWPNRTSVYVKDENDNVIWSGADQDWSIIVW